MILVIGGIASGKRTYVRSMGYADSEMSGDPASDVPVMTDICDYVFEYGQDVDIDRLCSMLQKKEVIICREVGSGVIPIDKRNRDVREDLGRISAILSKDAEKVIRMVCGIPIVLKG